MRRIMASQNYYGGQYPIWRIEEVGDMANFVRRSFIAIFGICAIAWAINAILVHRTDAPLADIAQRILSGDKFNAAQLSAMKRQLDTSPVRTCSRRQR